MKKILIIATGAFLMIENAMTSNIINMEQNSNRGTRLIEKVSPSGQFKDGAPIFEKNASITSKIRNSNKRIPNMELVEGHPLRIYSDNPETITLILKLLEDSKFEQNSDGVTQIQEVKPVADKRWCTDVRKKYFYNIKDRFF